MHSVTRGIGDTEARLALVCTRGTDHGVPAEGPKAGTGLHWGHGVPAEGQHWGTECPAVGQHWPALGHGVPVEGWHYLGHGVPGRRPALACTGARSARPKAGTPVPVRALSACWVQRDPMMRLCVFKHVCRALLRF